jgi:hypothetical protein
MDSDDDCDFLLQLAAEAEAEEANPVRGNQTLPSLLVKDDDTLLEEAYGRELMTKAMSGCSQEPCRPAPAQRQPHAPEERCLTSSRAAVLSSLHTRDDTRQKDVIAGYTEQTSGLRVCHDRNPCSKKLPNLHPSCFRLEMK